MSQIEDDVTKGVAKPDADTDTSTIDYEAEARKLGWRPKEEFRGRPELFVDAETFYKTGQVAVPLLKARTKALEDEIERLKQQGKEFAATVERAHAKEKAELEAQLAAAKEARRDAVASSDGEAFEVADARVKELENATKAPPPKKPTSTDTSTIPLDPEFEAWLKDNPDFNTDQETAAYALFLVRGDEFKPLYGKHRELYDKVWTKAKSIMAKARQSANSEIERPGPQRGGTRGGEDTDTIQSRGKRSYANLHPEFKRACDQMAKDYGATNIEKFRNRYVDGCDDTAFRS